MNYKKFIVSGASSRRTENFKMPFAVASLTLAIVLMLGSPMAYGQVFGAIFTTESSCDGTNENLFNKKSDVFLDGGPISPTSAGLPDGLYHVQVTSPNGIVLGSSVFVDTCVPTPPVLVVGGEFVTNGAFGGPCYELMKPNGNGGIHFPILRKMSSFDADGCGDPDGYDDTPNNGGVYKIWISMDPTFPNSLSKTDNFKVANGGSITEICALKFYDANGDGVQNNNEVPVPNWNFELWTVDGQDNPVELIACDNTDQNGIVCFLVDAPNNPNVDIRLLLLEVFPVELEWVNTTVTECIVIVNKNTALIEKEFGNICIGTVDVHTKGFWQNPNGCGIVSAHSEYLDYLNTLKPFEGPLNISTNGQDNCGGVACPAITVLPFDNAGELGCYIVAPNNQANDPNIQLAQQLAAFVLNALHFMGGVNTTFEVVVDNKTNTYTAIDLIDLAVVAWMSGENVDNIKNLLDDINNAGTVDIIFAEQCDFTPVVCPAIP